MAKIVPFKAVVYNPAKVADLAKVVCPPYDIISPGRQDYFYQLDPYNLIHLELSKDLPAEDKYEAAGSLFKEWLKKNILLRENDPAIYLYSQQYNLRGETKVRLGFLALLKLDEERSSVFGHEHTHLEPKEDRLRLIRKVGANLSPIFAVFSDKKRLIQQNLKPYAENQEPFIDIVDDEKIRHKVWRLDDAQLLKKIQLNMEKENIFIADGHHRYEVACAFRDEMKKNSGKLAGDEGFDYILAYFTNLDSLGLTVLPIHRLVKLDIGLKIQDLLERLKEYFYVEEIKERNRFLFLLQKAGQAEHVLGMYNGENYWLLRLKNVKFLDEILSAKPQEYRRLDVAILNAVVLEKVLGLDPLDKARVTFSADSEEALDKAGRDSSYLAFLLNPTKIEQIVAVALKGEKMPPKSTYFYPKVLSGLVINKHEG